MLKFIYFFIFFATSLFALDINNNTTFNELLPHAKIYIDHQKTATIDTIQNKNFTSNTKNSIGFGYSPDFNVWIKFTLTNNSQNIIQKIIEYDNPLTSYIELYEANTSKLLTKDGLLDTAKSRESIHPIFHITLQANESKTYYIKAYSNTTTLIVKLNLWNSDSFYKKEIHYQFILALFFGAMGIIIIYNFIIYLSTREKSYLYYILSFIGITIYYLFYKGVMNLYILSPELMLKTIEFSSFIVAMPVFFLALFTINILDLKQYPRMYRTLNYYLVVFPFLTLFVYLYDLNQHRSFFSILLLFMLVCMTLYALLKNNKQAKFLMVGWVVFFSSALFMYLSSLGIYDVFSTYPYYTEVSLIVEAIAFSYSLADRLKRLLEEKLHLQEKFTDYQKQEMQRLSTMVKEKTIDLEKSLDEKKLLLKELNHRVKNSMQTIISFVRLQKNDTLQQETHKILENLENKIFAINDLYALLHTSNNISTVDASKYFSLLINNVQKSFCRPEIDISLKTNITLDSDDAIYCGFILNEALTNAYQHAFSTHSGNIIITLKKEEDMYIFTIEDNGIGYTSKTTQSLGLIIINTLAKIQLEGSIDTHTSDGVKIKISWGKNG